MQSEAVCTDRCVAKFFAVHQFVGKKLTDMQQSVMAAEQPKWIAEKEMAIVLQGGQIDTRICISDISMCGGVDLR